MAVAIVAVAAVAIAGVAYAYTASTSNSGNTSTTGYATLTLGNGSNTAYAEAFTEAVKFNTEVTGSTNTGTEQVPVWTPTVTYTFDEDQRTILYDTVKGVELGTATIHIARTNVTDALYFSVTDNSSENNKEMNGTFYIAYSTDNSNWNYRVYTPTKDNFYKAENGAALTQDTDNLKTSIGTIASDVNTLYVKMYVSTMNAPTPGAAIVKPLVDITFTFKAYSESSLDAYIARIAG